MGPKSKNNNSNNKNNKKNNQTKKSYLAEDENYQSFSNQISKLGLQLRDITGDGNCLFRALSDQMEGDETHHIEYRKRVCNYMRENREEFEPFIAALIEDIDVASERKNIKKNKYEDYIKNLEKPGTYADNGCLVAFARLYKVDINIHQLNLPIWTIPGGDYNAPSTSTIIKANISKNNKIENKIKQLHLSYHNNEHYSSIRTIGDNSNKPTDIYFQNGSTDNKSSFKNKTSKYYDDYEDNLNESFDLQMNILNKGASNFNENDYLECKNIELTNNTFDKNGLHDENETDYELELMVEQIMDTTKCMDISLIKQKLIESGNNIDTAITVLYSLNNDYDHDISSSTSSNLNTDVNHSDSNNKNTKTSISKYDKKREKKQRQMERQKQKVAEENAKLSDNHNGSHKVECTSQNNNHSSINEPSYSVSLNVITKSI